MKWSSFLGFAALSAAAAGFSGGAERWASVTTVPTELVAAVERAERSVDIAGMTLDSTALAAALQRAQARGVTVRILVNPAVEKRSSALLLSLLGRSSVRLVPEKTEASDAFGVIDEEKVWSVPRAIGRGTSQAPDLVVDPALATSYASEFETLWRQGRSRSDP